MKSEYIVRNKTVENTSAKIIEFNSPELDLSFEAPGFLFSIHGKEDVEHFPIVNSGNIEELIGAHVPYYLLDEVGEEINKNLEDERQMLLTNGGLEVLYRANLEDEKEKLIKKLPFNEHQQKKINKLRNDAESRTQKKNLYQSVWDSIIEDPSEAVRFVYEYTLPMRQLDMPVINAPGIFIRETQQLDALEYLYEATENLFATGEDGTPNPERIALELNLSKSFIKKKENRKQLHKTYSRIEPEAIVVRIPDMDDPRNHDSKIERSWKSIMKELGAYSEDEGVPLYYISSSTEGPVSLTHGVDAFSTRPTKSGDLLEAEFKMKSEDMRRMWRENPHFVCGKIREYGGKRRLWDREELEEHIEEKNTFPWPFEIESYDPDEVSNMTKKNYREFAKKVSSKVYAQEIKEIKEAIEQNRVRKISGDYKEWMGDLQLFPN